MIFIRITFLLLVLMSLNVSAQTQKQPSEKINKTQAYKFDEYGKITNKKLKIRLTNFVRKMLENRSAGNIVSGNIVVYAPYERKMNQRADAKWKFLSKSGAGFIDFDMSIITFTAVKDEKLKTEFWIVPQGVEPPKFK